MGLASLDSAYTDALLCPPTAVPAPHISGERAIAVKSELRPQRSQAPSTAPSPPLAELVCEAQRRGIDISRELRAIDHRLAEMRGKLDTAQTRNRIAS